MTRSRTTRENVVNGTRSRTTSENIVNGSVRSACLRVAAVLALAPFSAGANPVLIQNATVHTVSAAGTLRNASVLIRDGRIEAVGAGAIGAPAGASVIDAAGAAITPGLFDAYTQLGLKEIDGVAETGDEATSDARFSASLDVADALNPRSSLVAINRLEGVTRALSAPQPGDRPVLISGLGAIINLGSIRDFVLKPRVAMFVQAGEPAAQLVGGSRPAAFALLRESFEEARNPKLWLGRPNREPLLSPLDVAALKPVLEGRVPLVASAHRAADIQSLLRLASEFNFRLIIEGGAEAHLLVAELAARKVAVIMDPTYNLPSRFESLAARADSAAILERAGVLIAFSNRDAHNSRNIRQLAGNAVAHGLPWEAALAAITHNPAKIYGVDGVLGSIEPGKSADLVIWDGDPLEVTSFPRQVFIDGQPVTMESRQTLLRDRYLRRLKP